MKKRTFNILNFLALNVLFFAVYLNFIHKDINTLPATSVSATAVKSFATSQMKNPLASNLQQPKKAKALEN